MSASPMNSSAPLGTMEASAEELVNRARVFLQPGQALDVTHVFIAALPGDDSSTPPTQITSTMLSVISQPEIVRAMLSVEIKLHSVPATTPGAITDALRRAATIWLQHSAERKARVTDAVVIWGILSDDNAVTHLLRELKVDRAALLDALSHNFQYLVPDADVRDDIRKSAHRVAPPSVSGDLVPAYLLAAELVRQVRPSLDHHFADMHAVLMSNILNVLGSCTRPEIAVLTGHNGTPMYSIPQVLADRFASD